MKRYLSAIFDRISATLRTHYGEVLKEPMPKRWVDLIHYLDEKDRRRGRSASHNSHGG